MRKFLILLMMGSFVLTSDARSAGFIGPRASIDLGAWTASFKEEGYGQNLKLRVTPALGISTAMGFQMGLIFVEYAPFFYFVQKFGFNDNKTNDASLFSVGIGQVGIDIPVIPVEAYAGGGIYNFGFATGTRNDFTGWGFKAGSAVKIGMPERAIKIRLEYHKIFFHEDDAGSLPEAIKANLEVIYLGVGIGLQIK